MAELDLLLKYINKKKCWRQFCPEPCEYSKPTNPQHCEPTLVTDMIEDFFGSGWTPVRKKLVELSNIHEMIREQESLPREFRKKIIVLDLFAGYGFSTAYFARVLGKKELDKLKIILIDAAKIIEAKLRVMSEEPTMKIVSLIGLAEDYLLWRFPELKGKARFVRAKAQKLPRATNSVSLIILNDLCLAQHLLTTKDLQPLTDEKSVEEARKTGAMPEYRIFFELMRVLAPGGRIVVAAQNDVSGLFERLGFTIIDKDEITLEEGFVQKAVEPYVNKIFINGEIKKTLRWFANSAKYPPNYNYTCHLFAATYNKPWLGPGEGVS